MLPSTTERLLISYGWADEALRDIYVPMNIGARVYSDGIACVCTIIDLRTNVYSHKAAIIHRNMVVVGVSGGNRAISKAAIVHRNSVVVG